MNPEIAELSVWGLWGVSWMLAALWADRATARAGVTTQWPYFALSVIGFSLLFQPPASSVAGARLWTTTPALAWAMVTLSVAGFAFCWWARLHLGRLWSGTVTRKAEHRIVDTGPYRWVRHPIYTGLLAAAAAQAVLAGTANAFAGAALMALAHVLKARVEEGFLKSQLGAESYDAYARRTPMLVPWPRRSRP